MLQLLAKMNKYRFCKDSHIKRGLVFHGDPFWVPCLQHLWDLPVVLETFAKSAHRRLNRGISQTIPPARTVFTKGLLSEALLLYLIIECAKESGYDHFHLLRPPETGSATGGATRN